MKKIGSLLILITCSANFLFACDICGCGVGSYYIGILPEFKKRFAGLRYQHKGLLTHISANGNTSYLTSNENYQSLELWGAVNIGKRFRLMGFVPLNTIERINQGVTTKKTGLGDIALVTYFQFLNSRHTIHTDKLLIQSLWIGGGIKLPTGEYDPTEKNISLEKQNTFQLGTGSVDFTANLMYDIRIMDAGLNANVSYKANTRNRYDYRYGNKFTANMLAYYKFNIKQKVTLAPNTGIMYENAALDEKDKNTQVEESGGYTTMATFGAEISFGRFSVGGNFQTPIAQQLSGNTVLAKDRFMTHIAVSF